MGASDIPCGLLDMGLSFKVCFPEGPEKTHFRLEKQAILEVQVASRDLPTYLPT